MNKLSICTCGHYRALHRMDYEFRLLDCNVCDCKKYHQDPPKPVDAIQGEKCFCGIVGAHSMQSHHESNLNNLAAPEPPKEPMKECACHEPHISDMVIHTKKECYLKPPVPEPPKGIKVKDFDVDKFLEQAIEAGRIIEARDKPPTPQNSDWEEKIAELLLLHDIYGEEKMGDPLLAIRPIIRKEIENAREHDDVVCKEAIEEAVTEALQSVRKDIAEKANAVFMKEYILKIIDSKLYE